MSDFIVSSQAFDHEDLIPEKYTCKGQNISPEITWEGMPGNTQSLALIMEDPDAPFGTFVHWVLYNIPSNIKRLSETIPNEEIIADRIVQGKNSFGKLGYGGPCPPPGSIHRYYFTLYAVGLQPDLQSGLNKKSLLKKIEDHILDNAVLMGKFKR